MRRLIYYGNAQDTSAVLIGSSFPAENAIQTERLGPRLLREDPSASWEISPANLLARMFVTLLKTTGLQTSLGMQYAG